MSDDILSFKVKVALKVEPELDGIVEQIKVDALNGVVTLSGQVPSDETAQAAERTALTVADVAGVSNELEVQA